MGQLEHRDLSVPKLRRQQLLGDGGAAPGILHRPIPEWHAERFAVEWVLGSAARVFSISIEASFWVAIGVAMLATCLIVADLLIRINLSVPAGIACMAVLVLTTYAIRSYLIGPGGVADLVFVVGVAISIWGLVVRSPLIVLGGLLLGTVARQTALPPAVVAAGAVVIDPAWRRLGRWRLPLSAALIAVPVVCYAVIRIVAHGFSGPSPSLSTITLLGASLSPGVLLQHFARCVNGLLSVGVLLVCVWWTMRRERRARLHLQPPSSGTLHAAYACLAFGAAIVIQPVVPNPVWAAENETRLAVLGLVPFVVALGLMMRELELVRASPVSPGVTVAAVGMLALGSLRHTFSLIGPANRAETVVLQAIVALGSRLCHAALGATACNYGLALR